MKDLLVFGTKLYLELNYFWKLMFSLSCHNLPQSNANLQVGGVLESTGDPLDDGYRDFKD